MDLGSEKTYLIASKQTNRRPKLLKEILLQIYTTNTQHRNNSNYLLALISYILASESNSLNFNVNMQNI